MSDRIGKTIDLKAPLARVWRALTDHRELGAWFRVALESPFTVGGAVRGHVTYPGYEHLVMEARVVAIEPQRYFAYTWHPYAVEPGVDYAQEPPTLVEFTLRAIDTGTRLTLVDPASTASRRIAATRRGA